MYREMAAGIKLAVRSAASIVESEDGRVRRGVRSRAAIVSALFDLIGEGVMRPTAQQVAERAKVNIRTVFRHFSEIDSLYAELDAHLYQEVRAVLDLEPPNAGVNQRADAMVQQRCALYEKVAPYRRSADRFRWRSEFLQKARNVMVKEERRLLYEWLPEVKSAPAPVRNAAELLMSFEAWNRLRSDQDLGREAARAAMSGALKALLRSR